MCGGDSEINRFAPLEAPIDLERANGLVGHGERFRDREPGLYAKTQRGGLKDSRCVELGLFGQFAVEVEGHVERLPGANFPFAYPQVRHPDEGCSAPTLNQRSLTPGFGYEHL